MAQCFQAVAGFVLPVRPLSRRARDVLGLGLEPQILQVYQHHACRTGTQKSQTGAEDCWQFRLRAGEQPLVMQEVPQRAKEFLAGLLLTVRLLRG